MKKVFVRTAFAVASFAMLLMAGCSGESSGGTKKTSDGTADIELSYDLLWHCENPDCEYSSGKELGYETQEEAENCDRHESCPGWKYTVTFTDDGESENEDVVLKIKKGTKIAQEDIPEWTNTDSLNTYKLVEWEADSEHSSLTVNSSITSDVTFTAGWRKYFTITFVDSEATGGDETIAAVENVEKEVFENEKTTAPEWEKDGYTLSWTPAFDSNVEITSNATYTALWTPRTKYTVTYKDSAAFEGDAVNADEAETVYEGDIPEKVPSWVKEHYNLSWESSVDGVAVNSEITEDVTFTAKWQEYEKFTVTFKDADGGTNADDVQSVYINEKAVVPSWVKEGYILTWTSSVAGLTATSAITATVTFTAVWTEIPDETVILFDNNGSKALDGNPKGYAVGSTAKDYGSSTHATYTTLAGTEIDVRYGVKLNSSGNIVLTLDAAYTVLLVQGTDKTYSKGLNIAASTDGGTSYGDAQNYPVIGTGSNVVSAELPAGTYKITNGGSETSVFAVILQK